MPYGNAEQSTMAQAARAARAKRDKKPSTPRHLTSGGVGASGYGTPKYVPGAAPKNTPDTTKKTPRVVDTSRAYAMGAGPGTGQPPGAQKAAQRRSTENTAGHPLSTDRDRLRKFESDKDAKMLAYRHGRVKMGAFKGDFYGPDQLKGNLSKVAAWRKSGLSVADFLKKK